MTAYAMLAVRWHAHVGQIEPRAVWADLARPPRIGRLQFALGQAHCCFTVYLASQKPATTEFMRCRRVQIEPANACGRHSLMRRQSSDSRSDVVYNCQFFEFVAFTLCIVLMHVY